MSNTVGAWSVLWWLINILRKIAVGILFGITIFLVLVLGLVFLASVYDRNFFSQPRDAFTHHAPQYMVVFEDIQKYCENASCSPEQLEPFLRAREEALIEDWPKLVDVLTQYWRWSKHPTDYVEGTDVRLKTYKVRDDFFRLLAEVGGKEALKKCTPIVLWRLGAGSGMAHAVQGVRCNEKEFSLVE